MPSNRNASKVTAVETPKETFRYVTKVRTWPVRVEYFFCRFIRKTKVDINGVFSNITKSFINTTGSLLMSLMCVYSTVVIFTIIK